MRRPSGSALAAALALALGACASAPAPRSTVTVSSLRDGDRAGARRAGVFEGMASWYGKEQHGHLTASGERFNMYALTAAHRTLKMGTRVRVVNLQNGRAVILRINDRGPYGRGRVIDVSYAAAKELDMLSAGVVRARIEVLAP